jgi:glycosyltransferase involved in cell wall biosynthesis
MTSLAPLVLSVFSTFAVGGPQVRFAAIANRFGDRFRHAVVALDGRTDCAARIGPHVPLSLLPMESTKGMGLVAGLMGLAGIRRALARVRPAVLITSNWGSIEWAMVAATIPGLRHIHMEDGFNPDEAEGQKRRRVLVRRLALRRAEVVLPSQTLLRIARETWRLPERRLHYIPNGLDLVRFHPRREARGEGPPVIGAVTKLRAEKNISRLLRACARLGEAPWRLEIIGDGPEQSMLEQLAAELGITNRVRFAGHVPDPAEAYHGFDIFALSSDTEQMPFSVLEAMASGLPVAATGVGDVCSMLSEGQASFVVGPDEAALAGVLAPLLADAGLRARLGAANRAKAERDYDQQAMFAAHASLIEGAGCASQAQRSAPAGERCTQSRIS